MTCSTKQWDQHSKLQLHIIDNVGRGEWRAACEQWVDACLVSCPGQYTPVRYLYNAYITDNQNNYIDIGQFGKVLKSRFPQGKRRKGKQGAQVYVYADVALKPEVLKGHSNGLASSETPQQEAAAVIPSMIVGNKELGQILVSVPEDATVSTAVHPLLTESMPNIVPVSSVDCHSLSCVSENEIPKLATEVSLHIPASGNDVPANCASDTFGIPRKHKAQEVSQDNTDTGIELLVSPPLQPATCKCPSQNLNSPVTDKSFQHMDNGSLATSNHRMSVAQQWVEEKVVHQKVTNNSFPAIRAALQCDHPHHPVSETSMSLHGEYPSNGKLMAHKGTSETVSDKHLDPAHTVTKSSSAAQATTMPPAITIAASLLGGSTCFTSSTSSLMQLSKSCNNHLEQSDQVPVVKESACCNQDGLRVKVEENTVEELPPSAEHMPAPVIIQEPQTHKNNEGEEKNSEKGGEESSEKGEINGRENQYKVQPDNRAKLFHVNGSPWVMIPVEQTQIMSTSSPLSNGIVVTPFPVSSYLAETPTLNLACHHIPPPGYGCISQNSPLNTLCTISQNCTSGNVSQNPLLTTVNQNPLFTTVSQNTVWKNIPSLDNTAVSILPEVTCQNPQPISGSQKFASAEVCYSESLVASENGEQVTMNSLPLPPPMNASKTEDHIIPVPVEELEREAVVNIPRGSGAKSESEVKSSGRVTVHEQPNVFTSVSSQRLPAAGEPLPDMNVLDYLRSEMADDNSVLESNLTFSSTFPKNRRNSCNNVHLNSKSQKAEMVTNPHTTDKKYDDSLINNKNHIMQSNISDGYCSAFDFTVRKNSSKGSEQNSPTEQILGTVTSPSAGTLISDDVSSDKFHNCKKSCSAGNSIAQNVDEQCERTSNNNVGDGESSIISRKRSWDEDIRSFITPCDDPVSDQSKASKKERRKGRSQTKAGSKESTVKRKNKKEKSLQANNQSKVLVVTDSEMSFCNNEEPEYNAETVKRAILNVCYEILSDTGITLTEVDTAVKLEAALYDKNPGVIYESDPGLSCTMSVALQCLNVESPDFCTALLMHHQTCTGLGCHRCHLLRAAYVHIVLFHHRCPIWEAFTRILRIHSQACTLVKCSVVFCLFMKHELHLTGASVLSNHPQEGRNKLSLKFNKCLKNGPHNFDLFCNNQKKKNLPLCAGGKSSDVEHSKMRMVVDLLLPSRVKDQDKATPILHSLHIAASQTHQAESK